MRISLRSLSIAALAVVGAACSDAPSRPARFSSKGRLAIAPVFSAEAAAVFARREQFAAVSFDHVHIVLQRNSGPSRGDKVVDTTVVFTPTSQEIQLDLTVDVEQVGDPFDATVEYTDAGVAVFRGTQTVQSHAVDSPPLSIPPIVLSYVGVGVGAKSVTINSKSLNLTHPASQTLSATVLDQNGNGMGDVPLSWSSSNTAVATINSVTGALATVGRGTTTITVLTPTGLRDNGTVAVTLPLTKLDLRSGGGQTGRVGATIGPVTVRALASDNQGVAGATVSFTPPSGGSVSPSTAVADGNGDVTATLTLGSAVGAQVFVASAVTASGSAITVSIPATATAGAPAAIQPVSGGNQADTIRLALKQPFTARVTDQFGNPISGVSVTWGRTTGSGSLSAASTTTNASGEASVNYTLGSTPGEESVSASTSGVNTTATFNASAIAAGPADVTIVSGNNQTGKALLPLDKPFVGVVVDRGGGTVAGATVTWTATNGSFESSTTVSDAQGQVRNTLKLAGKLGAASATASIPNGKVITFAATVRPGIPTHLTYRTQPSNAVAGVAVAPAIALELRDGADNIATDDDANIALAISANPGAATLSGTATRKSVNGVSTFDNMSLDKAANGYALVGISGALPQLVSAPFNISPAAAAKISIATGNNQTATVNTAVTTAPSVRVADAFDNPVPNQSVHFAPATGSGAANPTDVTTNAQGIATLTSWVLGTAVGPKSMVVSVPPVVQTVTFLATAIAGQATALAVTTQPSPTAIAGTPLAGQPVIQLMDVYGNPTGVGAPIAITATASSGPGTATNNTATAVAGTGTATFSGLTLNTRATVTLTFSAAPLTSVVSNAIAVSAGAPQAIALACTDNQTATVNTAVAAAPCVRVTDAQGNLVPGAAVVFAPSAGSGSVSPGATVVTDAQGLAGVGQWTLGTGAGGQSLDVSLRDFGSVAHVTFHATAIAGQASKLVMVRQPSTTGIAGAALAVQPIVQMQDQFNNPTGLGAPGGGIVATPSAGVATGNTANPNATGLATFASLALRTAGTQTVTFSGSGLQPVASQGIAIGPAAVASLQIVSGNNQNDSVTAFLPAPATARALDAFGNFVPGVPVTFTASGDGTVSASPVATNAQGTASTTWRLGSVAGSQTLAAGAPGATGVQFGAFARAGNATRIAFDPSFPTTGIVGVSLNPILVVLSDRFGNRATGSFDQVVLALTSGPEGADLISASGLSRQASNGIATFTGVAIDAVGISRITATAPNVNGGVSVLSGPISISSGALAQVQTTASDGITSTSGNIRGEVNQDGSPYSVWLEYGTNPSLATFFQTGTATGPNSVCPGVGICIWTANIGGLAPATPLYYRIVAQTSGGISRGGILSFTTLPGPVANGQATTAGSTNRTAVSRPGITPSAKPLDRP